MPITRKKRGMALAEMNIVPKVKNRWGFQEAGDVTSRLMGQSGSTVILLLYLVLIAADIGRGEEWSGGNECVKPLGMESYTIPPHQISASSSYNEENTGAQFGRVRTEKGAGAWCPREGIKQGVKEYLEIDFTREYRITQTETQGRYGGGMGVEYAENYQLEYWRDSLSRWVPYKDHLGRTILEGNTNTYMENKQQLNPPIISSKVRFIPYSLHIRTICMRVEAYGCNFTDGVVHYQAPQGYYKPNPELDFRDTTYDGEEDEDRILRSGLGLLTDMLYGSVDFIRNHKGWIGWERDNESTPVEIGFQFDQLRKFEYLTIHVNNFVSQGAQVFSIAKIHFSLDGKKFSSHTVAFCPKKDVKNDTVVLLKIPLFGRLASYLRVDLVHSDEWLLLSEISFRSEIFTGDPKSVDRMKSNWNGTGYAPSNTYHHECPEHNQKNKLVTAEQSTAAMIGLIVGCVFVCLLLSGVSVACFVMRKNRRNTKLVGVMGIGMTPKSMSIGLGLNGCPSDQLSTSTNTTKHLNKKSHVGSSSSVTLNGGKKLGKIALCDMNPVSISGDCQTDSDESLYHELVFGRNGPSVIIAKSGVGGGTTKSRKNSGSGSGGLSYSSLAVANNGSSVGSSCTSTAKTESDSGYSSSQQLVRKHCGLGTRKIKYQKVNHGADFSDVMAMRGMEEEMAYYHTHNQNLGQFLPSSPSTPSNGLRASSNKLPHLGQSMGSIPFSSSMSPSVHGPPSPVQPFRISFMSQQHPHPPPIQFSDNHNPISHNSHLTLGPKSMSSISTGSNNNGYMNTVGNRERSTNGLFNSPRVNNRRNPSNNNNQHNHPSAGVNTISAALSAHNNMNGGALMTLNCGSGVSSGNNIANTHFQLPANSFGVSLMKSSGLSTSSNPASSNHHPLGPLGICGGGESNYYAATDIFQVPDKHFDRF